MTDYNAPPPPPPPPPPPGGGGGGYGPPPGGGGGGYGPPGGGGGGYEPPGGYPPPPGGYPPPAQPAGNDRSQLLGILGIVIGLLCCWPAGLVLGVISIVQANKYGSNKLWGILAIVASVVGVIISFAVTIPQINNT